MLESRMCFMRILILRFAATGFGVKEVMYCVVAFPLIQRAQELLQVLRCPFTAKAWELRSRHAKCWMNRGLRV